MITYTQYKPAEALAHLIECYWVCRAPAMTMSPLERLIPGGRAELIFYFGNAMQFLLSDDLLPGSIVPDTFIMGQRSHIYYTRQNGATDLLGVRFKPGGISLLAKMPAADMLNKIVPAGEVLDMAVENWKARLLEKKKDAERIYLLDQLITQILKVPTNEWLACNKTVETIRHKDHITVNALCNENEFYYKKLERAFLQNIGYTPKYYQRIVRFNKAIRQMQANQNSLTSICYDCGYYDQSHFIKDFRQFAGTRPKQFQAENHTIADFLIHHQAV
ncbi:MAG: AraC family transcriptional regulator [Ferruginibacter sp.]|uniref:helix-turn-helix domain-containing protein n=1 Tax=Ferruginibacter sp. TaxID=1940288 RepID=UPI00265AE35E|nr:helix-turn-helix domain-containing protein [Ferruginibacter sp.]MDB5279713.1 AraC family transcriptional regulator [Ferruginibacter sp.]